MAFHQKKVTFMALAVLTIFATAATITPNHKFKNLKVLPQDISEKQLDSTMDAFCKALKVNCDFCHSAPKNLVALTPVNNEIDFALDNDMKETARKMMRMTMNINKKYFDLDSTARPENQYLISCNTCHRGNPFPANE
jgi:hypothetical protein